MTLACAIAVGWALAVGYCLGRYGRLRAMTSRYSRFLYTGPIDTRVPTDIDHTPRRTP